MSVYRVISNYYNDFLNFLSEENVKSGGLDNMFQTITNDKKKLIVTKLTDMMVRFNSAFQNEIQFWTNKEKEQNLFMIIYIIMIFLILIIVIILLLFRFKELKAAPPPEVLNGTVGMQTVRIKSILSHVIVYHIILSIFTVFLVNVTAVKRLCQGQVALLKEDMQIYSNFIFKKDTSGQLPTELVKYGYCKRSGNENIIKITKNATSKQYKGNCEFEVDSSDTTTGKVNKHQLASEVEVYDKFRPDIESSLKDFFNDGNGYLNVKKLLLQSSPILMLKESKRIMNYYYLLSYKKQNEDPSKKEKKQDIIKTVVVDPLSDLLTSFDPSDSSGTLDTEAIAQNMQIPEVSDAIVRLFIAFTFLAFFLYPIYIKTPDTSNNFPKNLLPFMPQNMNIGSFEPKYKDFAIGLKTAFTNVYNTDYKPILNTVATIDDPTPAMNDITMKLLPLFRDLYYRVFIKLKGTTWFPFNKEYITLQLNETFKSSTGAAALPADYKTFFIDIVYDPLVTSISGNFDVLALKRSDMIDTMSTALVSYKLSALPYQNYIINTIISKNSKSERYIDDLNEFLVELDNTITLKKGQLLEATDIDQKKFMDTDEFIDTLKNLSYNNLKKGFEVEYFKEVIEKFYNVISESVNLKAANNRNIYYQRQTAIKVWNVAIIMTIIAIILVWVRIVIPTLTEITKIKRVNVERDCDKLFAERDLRSRQINWGIKLIVPLVFIAFIISMLIAFRKKMSATFDFNKEIIENNTSELKKSLDEMAMKLKYFESKLDEGDRYQKFSMIDQSKITDADKKELFASLKNIVDKYEKCNYIIESAKTTIPFPYPEVIMHGFMLTITVFGILYAMSTFAPIKRLKDIKKLNKLKAKVLITDNMQEINEELASHSVCHNEDMDSVVIALKIIFFTFIIMFLIFYSVKIASSANDFKFGLYNSAYFEESRCYEN